jgi:hypothetical protein
MATYSNTLTDQFGNALAGATVYVYDVDHEELLQTVEADEDGAFSFIADDGLYTLEILSGTSTKVVPGVEVGNADELFKGDPGGNVMATGAFAVLSTLAIPVGTDLIRTSEYSAGSSVGGAFYVYDEDVDASYVSANPRTSAISLNGRGFRLSLEQAVTIEMTGAVAGGVTDCAGAIQAALDSGAAEVFIPQKTFLFNTPLTASVNLTGMGHESILKVGAAMNRAITYTKISGVCRDFRINGEGLAKTLLYGANCQSSRFSGLKLHQAKFDAAELGSTGNNSGSIFDGCQFTSVGTTTTGTCSSSTNSVVWTGTNLTTLGIRPHVDMVRVAGKAYTIASVVDATHLTTTQTVGTNAAGTAAAILQGSGLLINNNGDNSGIEARKCMAHVCAAAGYKDMALYGLQTDGCYAEVCEWGRVIGVAGVVNTFGSAAYDDYQEGHLSGSYLLEHSLYPRLHPTQLPGGNGPMEDLLAAICIRDSGLVVGGEFSYGGVEFKGRRADVGNPTTYTAAFGEALYVSTALSAPFTINLPPMPTGSSLAVLKALEGGTIPIYFLGINGQTGTIKTIDGTTINGIAGSTGVAHTGSNTPRTYATPTPTGNWHFG